MDFANTSLSSTQDIASTVPARLHHAAYVCADQERTRHFYEDLIGIPLSAFWIEREVIGGEAHEMSHAFYALADGGAIAFFNFADPALQARYTAKRQEMFIHLALKVSKEQQDRVRERLTQAGIGVFEADHGFTFSIYFNDPDGQLIELSADPEDIAEIDARQRTTAHASLRRWLAGDRTPNNALRSETVLGGTGHDIAVIR